MSQGAHADCDGGGKRAAEKGASRAAALGYANSSKAVMDHMNTEDKMQGDGVTIRDSIGREQNMTIINTSSLYSLARKRTGGSYK